MSKQTLKDFVIEYSKENEYPFGSKEEIYETFIEELSDKVWTGEADQHRWYTRFPCVYKVNINDEDRFFKYWYMTSDGDNSNEDNGWEDPDLDELKEVYPYEVVTTLYK